MAQRVIVIGGGAAGMLAAGRAGEKGAEVVLLEKNSCLGRKIAITGKGRCNLTNSGSVEKIIDNFPGKGQFLYSSLNKFSNQDIQELIEELGVPLKCERGGRIFPVSDKAADIVDALARYLKKNQVKVRLGTKVLEIIVGDGVIKGVKTEQELLEASKVILATGGKSYPGTGSTGDGYRWADSLGHTIIPVKPALVPLNIKEEGVKELQGLSLKNVEAQILQGKKVLGREFGEMMFTHFGVSGPIILTLSRLVVDTFSKEKIILRIDLKPALDIEKVDRRLQRDFIMFQKKQIKNALFDLLPKRMIDHVLQKANITSDKFVNQLTKEERHTLVNVLKGFDLTVSGPRSLEEAIVTRGGVSLKEINPRTMESKLVKGLYIVGEVLDIDGFTGGYNLQAAFSTGYAAGEAAAKH